jgi:hypothetical protein
LKAISWSGNPVKTLQGVAAKMRVFHNDPLIDFDRSRE